MNNWNEEYFNLEKRVEIIDNILPEGLCEKILNDYGDKLQVDRTNRHSWPDSIMAPTTGLVLINDLDKDLSSEIIEHITNSTNFTTDTNKGMFYRWTPLAYITKHTDYGYAQAISIYLNKDWETDDGGIFMYRMNKDDNWIGVEPIYNRACISYGDIEHWTTPVTGNKDRKSIQIFGHEY
jgi:hypothetical protein